MHSAKSRSCVIEYTSGSGHFRKGSGLGGDSRGLTVFPPQTSARHYPSSSAPPKGGAYVIFQGLSCHINRPFWMCLHLANSPPHLWNGDLQRDTVRGADEILHSGVQGPKVASESYLTTGSRPWQWCWPWICHHHPAAPTRMTSSPSCQERPASGRGRSLTRDKKPLHAILRDFYLAY